MKNTLFCHEEALKLTKELVAIESHYFHEDKIMDFVLHWLNDHGVPARLHTFFEEKYTNFHGKNVVGCLDSGVQGPTILLNGHLDTVTLCKGWTKPPYEGVVEHGLLYGVGASDMKAGCAAIMLALSEFAGSGLPYKGKILFSFVSDEEGPYGLGTTFLVNDRIFDMANVDFAIIGESASGFGGGAFPCIAAGAKGGYNFTINVYGKSAHAASPEKGVNAILQASAIAQAISSSQRTTDDKLGSGATCVIRMNGGGASCSVPDYAEIEVFRHTVRGETLDTVKESVRAAIESIGQDISYSIEFRPGPAEGFDGGFAPYCTDEDNRYFKILKSSAEKLTGKKAEINYIDSIGDFNIIGGTLGIPTALMGPAGANFHSFDEYVDICSTTKTAETLYDFLREALR